MYEPTVLMQLARGSQYPPTAHSSRSSKQVGPVKPVPSQLQVFGAEQTPPFMHPYVHDGTQPVFPSPEYPEGQAEQVYEPLVLVHFVLGSHAVKFFIRHSLRSSSHWVPTHPVPVQLHTPAPTQGVSC